MQKILFTITFIGLIALSYGQTITIQEARDLGPGATVTVEGVVTNGSELGTIRYLQDETGGIAAYSSSLSNLNRGDKVSITGEIKDYNNLLEFDPVDDHEVISTGNPEPDPVVITPNQMSEDYESELIRINSAVFANGGGTFAGNTSYNFTSAGQNSTVYVRSNHPLIGEVIPAGQVDIIGICSQFYDNYQLLIRDIDDIINDATISIISPVATANISTDGFTISWETNAEGTTEAFYGFTPSLEAGHLSNTTIGTLHSLDIAGLDAAQIVYLKAFSVKEGDTAFSSVAVSSTQSLSSGDIKVYFTKSVDHSVSTGTDAIWLDDAADDTLIAYINRAKYSLDIAIYNFNISQIANAINNAHDRGVDVRIVYDGETANLAMQVVDPEIPRLASPVESEYGIMHNKFMIIDAESTDPNDPLVWTGSTNWTTNNMYDDQNNIIIFQDQALARAYTIEFNEMFGSAGMQPNPQNAKFGPYKSNNTPQDFMIGSRYVELFFSPSDQTNAQIVNAIESANADVNVATMLITRSDIAYALRDKETSGINTDVLVNSEGECSPLVVSTLAGALGYDFKESGESNTMHNKYLIVDHSRVNSDPLVLTGCHNWSNSAESKNDENTVIVHDATIANIYYQEFMARFNAGNSLDIDEYELMDDHFKVFPNPASDRVSVLFNSQTNDILNFSVCDLMGRTVYKNTNPVQPGENLFDVEFDLDEGVYVLILNQGKKTVQQKLIVR